MNPNTVPVYCYANFFTNINPADAGTSLLRRLLLDESKFRLVPIEEALAGIFNDSLGAHFEVRKLKGKLGKPYPMIITILPLHSRLVQGVSSGNHSYLKASAGQIYEFLTDMYELLRRHSALEERKLAETGT